MKKIIKKFIEAFRQLWYYPKPSFGTGLSVNYDQYWKQRRAEDKPSLSLWQEQRLYIIKDFIDKGSTVLDVGCGDGAVLYHLNKLKNTKGIGVDISDRVLAQAKTLGIETIKMDITNFSEIDLLPEVDYLTGFEMIEHMPKTEEFIFKISKKVRKGLIFSVPNTGYFSHRFRLLFGSFPLQWVSHPAEHLRYWTVRDMKFWVKEMGFPLRNLVLYEGVPFLNKVWPSMFAQGMVVFLDPKININK